MRAAAVSNPDATRVCADFPDPQQQPGKEPPALAGAGLHHVVRAGPRGGRCGPDRGGAPGPRGSRPVAVGTNPVAEAAFAALGGVGADAAIDYVQIDSLPGTAASLPAALRSRRIRLTGRGSVSKVHTIAEVPEIIARFGDGTFDAPHAVIRSVASARHGRTRGGPARSSSRTDRDRFEECGGRHRARRASVDG